MEEAEATTPALQIENGPAHKPVSSKPEERVTVTDPVYEQGAREEENPDIGGAAVEEAATGTATGGNDDTHVWGQEAREGEETTTTTTETVQQHWMEADGNNDDDIPSDPQTDSKTRFRAWKAAAEQTPALTVRKALRETAIAANHSKPTETIVQEHAMDDENTDVAAEDIGVTQTPASKHSGDACNQTPTGQQQEPAEDALRRRALREQGERAARAATWQAEHRRPENAGDEEPWQTRVAEDDEESLADGNNRDQKGNGRGFRDGNGNRASKKRSHRSH